MEIEIDLRLFFHFHIFSWQNLTIVMGDKTFTVYGSNPLIHFFIEENTLHLIIQIEIPGKYNMTLIWNRHMNLFIKLFRETKVMGSRFLICLSSLLSKQSSTCIPTSGIKMIPYHFGIWDTHSHQLNHKKQLFVCFSHLNRPSPPEQLWWWTI